MSKTVINDFSERKAYIITGPTSGIGRATALELAKYGTIVLVGRNPKKLEELQNIIEQKVQLYNVQLKTNVHFVRTKRDMACTLDNFMIQYPLEIG